ncbi:hypothetical protein DFH09DRAFT_1110075 [Mycena vulgaris]|nr:hypothetical protein DFH09DRAFT_1110075 [Mycena vulgaris]
MGKTFCARSLRVFQSARSGTTTCEIVKGELNGEYHYSTFNTQPAFSRILQFANPPTKAVQYAGNVSLPDLPVLFPNIRSSLLNYLPLQCVREPGPRFSNQIGRTGKEGVGREAGAARPRKSTGGRPAETCRGKLGAVRRQEAGVWRGEAGGRRNAGCGRIEGGGGGGTRSKREGKQNVLANSAGGGDHAGTSANRRVASPARGRERGL